MCVLEKLFQGLQKDDNASRLAWSESILQLSVEDANFLHKLMMSDKAHFNLTKLDIVYHIKIRDKFMNGLYIHVWCAIWSEGIVESFFFK